MFNSSALGQFSTELENILIQTQVIKIAIFGNPQSGKSVFLLRYHPLGNYRSHFQIHMMTNLSTQSGETEESAIIRTREEMLQVLRVEQCGRSQNATDVIASHKSNPTKYFRKDVYATDGAFQAYKTSVRCMNPHFNAEIYRMLDDENTSLAATKEEEHWNNNNKQIHNNNGSLLAMKTQTETETETEQKWEEEIVNIKTRTADTNIERNKHILESDGILVMFDYTDKNGLQSLRPLLDSIFQLKEYQMVKDMTNASQEVVVHYPVTIVGTKYDFPKHMRHISFAEQILFANEYNVSFARFDASAYSPALRIVQSLVYNILMFLKYQALSDERKDTLMSTARRTQRQTDAECCHIL